MNIHLENIKKLLQDDTLPEDKRQILLKAITDAEKQWSITDFKLDRTEKVKKTTAILLEETIEELEQKRKSVEDKNRELEIESSLERVRTVAMGMIKADDLLKICEVQFNELKQLGFSDIRNALIDIFNDESNYLTDYDYSDFLGGTIQKIPYNEYPVIDRSIRQLKSATNAFTEFVVEGEGLKEWKAFRKQNGEDDDTRIKDTDALYYYFYSISQGNIGISTFKKISEVQLAILKRFRNVFDLAYKRYVDINNAEAQARESQIQLALERVRARTMAMQKSDELPEAANMLFQQVQSLGIPAWSAGYCIWNEDKSTVTLWMSSEGVLQPPFKAPTTEDELFIEMRKGQEEGKTCHVVEMGGEKLLKHYQYMRTLPVVGEILDSIVTAGHPLPTFQIMHHAYFSKGYLLFITYEPVPDAHDIFQRFAKVFDQTYTRFLDLQKAEAQSRESQIQLALERVRARTMAMQKSDELGEVSSLLFQQLKSLGVDSYSSGFTIWDNDSNDLISWMCNADGSMNPPFRMPIAGDAWHIRQYESWRKGKDFILNDMTGELMQFYFRYLRSFPLLDAAFEKSIAAGHRMPERQVHNVANFSHGNLLFITLEPYPDAHDIFRRFAKIFDQTYTRFLDLQKAEAQARESQIQLALERVRARTMAMQRSDELSETVFILFQQFKQLGENPDQATIGIINEDEWVIEYWVTIYGNQTNRVYKFPIDEPNVTNKIYKGWKEQKKSLVIDLSGKELYDYTTFRESMGGAAYNEKEKKRVINVAFFSKGLINVQSNESRSAESIRLLERFAAVFEQTYTRFLDLQKAEAQAKEAQIEAALERVRSRSMGMQKSEELKEVIQVVYEQFVHLNINTQHTGFVMDYKLRDDRLIWVAGKHGVPSQLTIPYFDCEYYNRFNEAKEKGWDFFATNLGFEEKNSFYQELFTYIPGLPEEDKEFYFSCPGLAISTVLLENIGLYIENFEGIPYSDEDNAILMRFGNVFQQTYTRFLDLQKAEAQAREAQIEAALEKVRSRSLAMHKSDELNEVVTILFEKIKELRIPVTAVGIGIYIDVSKDMNTYVCGENEDRLVINNYCLPYFHHKIWKDLNNAREKQLDFFKGNYSKEEKNSFYKYVLEHSALRHLPDDIKRLIFESPAYTISMVPVNHSMFMINDFEGKILSENEVDIIKRFARVFDQAYTRFLDLQKAEAQAREAKIETALERVRSKTMAMHNSQDVGDTVATLFEELVKLGVHTNRCGILINSEDRMQAEVWTAKSNPAGKANLIIGLLDLTMHPLLEGIYHAWKSKEPVFSYTMLGTDLKAYYQAINDTKYYPTRFDLDALPAREFHTDFYFTEGSIFAFTSEPIQEEGASIFNRFAKLFGQTYRRYLDLQKAEAQAREAQIEAALERTRTQSMIMQHSNELDDTLRVFHEQVLLLGIHSAFSFLWLPDEEKDRHIFWAAWKENDLTAFKSKAINYTLDRNEPATAQCLIDWKGNEPIVSYQVPPSGVESYFAAWQELIDGVEKLKPEYFAGGLYYVEAFMKYGCFGVMVATDLTEDEKKILGRFAIEFERTYTRFLDLQKAEAQARQAKIEAAMEKVRSRAMAMQRPDELVEVAELLRKEMALLGVEELETSSIYIHHEDSQKTECWYAIKDVVNKEKKLVSDHMTIDLNDTWVGRQMLEFYRSNKKQISISMQGDNRKEWINYCADHSKVLVGFYGDTIPDRTYHLYKFSNGYMGAASPGDISAESWDLLQRATSVFSLAYTRFSDLQQAEAQARESKIEVALERVRSRTLAMQKSDELAETAAVLFQQLIALGIEPNRLYISIVKGETGETEFWITDEDGSKVSTAFAANMNDNITFYKMYEGWKQQKKSLVIDMQGEELQNYFRHLTSLGVPFKGGLIQKRRVQDIAYFSKGFIGMASPDEQPAETLALLERFAAVFNLTFTRFNDLKIAEAHSQQAEQDLIAIKEAKQKAEVALTELQSTQKQLIQSEKMASLGELTAGIAHEIQNPLNFVNNFSEVSKELLDEMREAIEKGDTEEAKEIMNDVIQNLEKINHHGKRADGIVKGMLQHSRSSSATKEPTDINKLADEYLRLAYHGLRAKDKSFNATLKTDYDETIGSISIIPQDIGRVVLNLITNAFYAVDEKKKQQPQGYEPTVSVNTKKVADKILISVKDNGNGIPHKVLDKIFQPFFTTKPTGQGTGLGLSLAYDIVKAHGGELKVDTKEARQDDAVGRGEGTIFTISLPQLMH